MSDQPGKSILDEIYPQMANQPHPEEPQFTGPKVDRSKTDLKTIAAVFFGSVFVIWIVRSLMGLN